MAAGRIGCYGISSNTAVNPPDDPEATSLAAMLEAAAQAGGPEHHFRLLQVPMNLFESGALLTPNTGPASGRSVLELAAEAGIAVLVNRPLNAIAGDGMVRLADFAPEGEEGEIPMEEVLRRVGQLETEFRERIASRLQIPKGGMPPTDWFRWAEQLPRLPAHMRTLDQWEHIEAERITPMVAQMVAALDQGLSGPLAEAWVGWRDQYLPALQTLLDAFREEAARHTQGVSDKVSAAIAGYLPLVRQGESLSRKALWILMSTPGVSAVLLGMRHPAYVEDGMEVLKWPSLTGVREIYEAMRQVRVP